MREGSKDGLDDCEIILHAKQNLEVWQVGREEGGEGLLVEVDLEQV